MRRKRWRDNNKEYIREAQLKRKYGLTIQDYERMVEEQGGICASCHQRARLVIDHCHTTGRVRELLCHPCNVAIGLLKEDPMIVIAAAEYLQRHDPTYEENEDCDAHS